MKTFTKPTWNTTAVLESPYLPAIAKLQTHLKNQWSYFFEEGLKDLQQSATLSQWPEEDLNKTDKAVN